MTDGEGSVGDVDDQEITDECAMLIHTGHMHKHMHIKGGQDKASGNKYISIVNILLIAEYEKIVFLTMKSFTCIIITMHTIIHKYI